MHHLTRWFSGGRYRCWIHEQHIDVQFVIHGRPTYRGLQVEVTVSAASKRPLRPILIPRDRQAHGGLRMAFVEQLPQLAPCSSVVDALYRFAIAVGVAVACVVCEDCVGCRAC